MFHRESGPAFAAKVAVLWLFSLPPWGVLLALHGREAALGYRSYDELMWAFKAFPLFRLPEFLIGMALALRAWETAQAPAPHRAAYEELAGGGDDSSAAEEWSRPGLPSLALAAAALAAVAAYVAVGTASFDPSCRCLDVAG